MNENVQLQEMYTSDVKESQELRFYEVMILSCAKVYRVDDKDENCRST